MVRQVQSPSVRQVVNPKIQGTLQSPFERDPLIGKVVCGQFALEKKVSGGGMANVYVARNRTLGTHLAVKVLREDLPDAYAPDRLKLEAAVMATIHHPNVVRIFDHGEVEGLPYIAMEYLYGGSLADMRQDRITAQNSGPYLSLSESIEIILQICQAIIPLHRLGLIHRDLKPANILLDISPGVEKPIIKVCDFGLVARHDMYEVSAALLPLVTSVGDLTPPGASAGTPSAMAPEQFMGTHSFTTDVYAVCAMLYEFVSGKRPYGNPAPDTTVTEWYALKNKPVRPLREANPEVTVHPLLESIVMRGLAIEPADRFQTISELHDALLGVQSAIRSPAHSPSIQVPASAPSLQLRSSLWQYTRYVAIGALLSAGAAFLSFSQGTQSIPVTPTPAPVATSSVMIDCNPIGAQVFDETGMLLGTTPLEINPTLLKSSFITIKAAGHTKKSIVISKQSNGFIYVDLSKE